MKQQLKNGKIFGRGAIDDKGPVVASLYAMKAIKDNIKINSRIRLILGINEENGWNCIKHYKETEEYPVLGFSPDADFPCIYAEKGMTTLYIKEDYSQYCNLPIKISNINCNNNAMNVVPKYCEVVLEVDKKRVSIAELESFIIEKIKKTKLNVECFIKENKIILQSFGIQAHAAYPSLGKNAISPIIILLNKIFNKINSPINIFKFFEKYINTELNGKSMKINFVDESGELTLNVGKFGFYENNLQVGINLRIPVKTDIQNVINCIEEKTSNYNLELITASIMQPLYVPKESQIVQTLCNIFNTETNLNYEPITTGGGTYARAFDNFVAFGANFPGDTDMCHQANEFIDIDKQILSCKIYARAIYELANM